MTLTQTDAQIGRMEDAVNTNSRPSELKITDIRVAVVASNYDYPLIRIDTNQGISGIGEVRDAGHAGNALQFKSMLLGQNPCNIDMLFRTIKKYGNWGREGGGVSGIEIALMDLIGKVYGVPCYQLLGGKYRDRVRIYGDTPTPDNPTPDDFVKAVLDRRDRGLTFIKFDLRPSLFESGEFPLVGHEAKYDYNFEAGGHRWRAPMAGRGVKLTQKNIEAAAHVVASVREAVGPSVQLCVDHFGEGYLSTDEVIRFGQALEKYDLVWMEDPVPFMDMTAHKKVSDALLTPIASGENLYLREGFREAIRTRAFDILHPDMLSSGGLLETKRIADDGEEEGLPTALHCAASPIGFMANVHCAAAISSFLAVEHHGLDLPFWHDLVTGFEDDYLAGGYVKVPEKPGLGLDLNLDAVEENLRTPGTMFLPTDEWDLPKLSFWRPDNRWPE